MSRNPEGGKVLSLCGQFPVTSITQKTLLDHDKSYHEVRVLPAINITKQTCDSSVLLPESLPAVEEKQRTTKTKKQRCEIESTVENIPVNLSSLVAFCELWVAALHLGFF